MIRKYHIRFKYFGYANKYNIGNNKAGNKTSNPLSNQILTNMVLSIINWKLQQQVQQLAKLKNNKPANNHEKVQLQLQDLNFANLNQTRTRIMEQTSEQVSTTEAAMSSIKKMERNGIPMHLHNKHLTCEVNT